ncbi:MAG: hypothetical protein IPI28_07580 [Candidatus Omnitrophica bacterium]|nr:hypothetical protein [Candidatus Omnitrophota bacterium]
MKPSSDIYIIPASHLDYGWAASPGECFSYVSEIIRMAIEDIEEHPDFRFTIEYAIFAKHFLEVYPEYFPRLKRLVKKGKIEICPSMSGFIEHFMDGEMVIHHWSKGKDGSGKPLVSIRSQHNIRTCRDTSFKSPSFCLAAGSPTLPTRGTTRPYRCIAGVHRMVQLSLPVATSILRWISPVPGKVMDGGG